MQFEARELKPVAEPVSPAELRRGRRISHSTLSVTTASSPPQKMGRGEKNSPLSARTREERGICNQGTVELSDLEITCCLDRRGMCQSPCRCKPLQEQELQEVPVPARNPTCSRGHRASGPSLPRSSRLTPRDSRH